ncbi:MAG: hypothetical protein ABR910_18285 [Acidobacteriaceae bacterium]|jgi:hypothetical protein
MALEHKYTLVCEDIRQENTGKWLIIGLYTHNITTAQLPFFMPSLAFFFCLTADAVGQHRFKVELRHLDTGTLIAPELAGALGIQKPGPVILPIKLPPLQFRAHGSYSISAEFEGHTEPFMTEFTVELAQMPPMPTMPFRQ